MGDGKKWYFMDMASKLGVYEFLTMFLSGSLIMFVFMGWGWTAFNDTNTCCCFNVVSKVYVFLFSIFAFTSGLIWHRIVECFRSCFEKMKKSSEGSNESDSKKSVSWFKIFIGTVFCRNFSLGIKKAKNDVNNTEGVDISYYKAYDNVIRTEYKNTITQLECQEAFLRDITVPLFVFVGFALFCNDFLFSGSIGCCSCKIAISVVTIVFVLVARYRTQMNVFRSVWECSKIVSENRKNEY